jgi:putative ABC transport system ATP-binding protein
LWRHAAVAVDALIGRSEVTKRYPGGSHPAVDRVSLTVASGQAGTVMGPSGGGRPALLNLIAGLSRPGSGTVTVAGQPIDTLSETRVAGFRCAQVGMIFQFLNLLDDLAVPGNVLAARLAGLRPTRARAAGLLEALGIDRHSDAYPGRLPGGGGSGWRSPARC